MLVEFRRQPDGEIVEIETSHVEAVVPARGEMAFTLIRLSGGRDVVVRGSKDDVAAKLDVTEERPAFRDDY